jgi:ABC-2 type transport system ATP-binding protein
MIVVENLRKFYGNFEAVSGISFQIAPGEFFGLLGPNGAGKTTTIGMLTGLISPTAGKIFIDGQDLESNLDTCKSKIGLVPQDLAFYPTLSALDNLIFFGKIFGLRGYDLVKRIDEVLGMVSLSDFKKQPVESYSNGMKRRLNIAIGLLHRPCIIVLDEPTVGVDAQSRSAIFDSLRELNQAGVTVIYTTHYMEEAQTLCHRLSIIDQGRLIQTDSPSELINRFSDPVVKIEFKHKMNSYLYEQVKAISPSAMLDKTGRWIFIKSTDPAQTVKKILELPAIKNTEIQSMDISKPNLEDVFLKLTGRSLRDTERQ